MGGSAALADAIECFDRGDLDGCRTRLDQVRRVTSPQVPAEVYLFEGLCERRLGRLGAAVELLRKAAEIGPGEAHVLLELGLAIIECGQTQEGLDVLREAVRASGDTPRYRHEFYLQNAIALYGEGFVEPAITSLRKALRFDPDADTWHLLGHLLLELERPAEALDAMRAGLEHHPTDAGLHHVLGLALAVGREPFQAAQAFTRALELDPRNAEPLHSLGMCFESMDDPARAIEAYERCLGLPCSEAVRADARDRIARLKQRLEA